MDIADCAQDLIEINLQASLSRVKKLPTQSRPDCIECGDPIPTERRESVNAIRCICCQDDFERLR